MGFIHVTDRHGKTHDLEAVEGWRVMEIIREHGLPIEAVCGGACECATCHVYVAPEWQEKLFPPRQDEEDRLDELPDINQASRLSCQIIWQEELNGLQLTLAQD